MPTKLPPLDIRPEPPMDYIETIEITFRGGTTPDKVVSISLALATYHHCSITLHWRSAIRIVNEHTDMLGLLRELQEHIS